MNKQQLLDFLSKAIDEGARIDIMFNSEGKTKADALHSCLEFAEIIDGNLEVVNYNDNSWYKVKTNKFQLDHFYDSEKFMTDDVDLSGMESGDRIA